MKLIQILLNFTVVIALIQQSGITFSLLLNIFQYNDEISSTELRNHVIIYKFAQIFITIIFLLISKFHKKTKLFSIIYLLTGVFIAFKIPVEWFFVTDSYWMNIIIWSYIYLLAILLYFEPNSSNKTKCITQGKILYYRRMLKEKRIEK